MSTVTISKIQYEALKQQADAYKRIVSATENELFSPPPTRDRRQVLRALTQTKRYSPAFLKSVEKGLARSRFFN